MQDPNVREADGRVNANTSDWLKIWAYLFKNKVKTLVDLWQFLKVGALRVLGVVDFPVPPNSKMRSTSSNSVRHYFESGIRTATPILAAAAAAGLDLRKRLQVLDFGCGVARQIVQIQRSHPHFVMHACDVNGGAVEYVAKTFPAVTAYTNLFSPPLRYESKQLDFVYSVSIFSHLTVADQERWLTELSRVVRPGGVLCLTVMGAHAIDRWAGMEVDARIAAHRTLESSGHLYLGAPKPAWMLKAEKISLFGSNLIGIDEDYGDTFYSEDYIRKNWAIADLEVVSWIPGIIDNLQDLVVLRRRN
ncbi:MAG: methyltransferase domain-containing protein [Burkholderiales bacterium]|nr:methyltransferase domain-containing protein [Burkholderiales bacterium]